MDLRPFVNCSLEHRYDEALKADFIIYRVYNGLNKVVVLGAAAQIHTANQHLKIHGPSRVFYCGVSCSSKDATHPLILSNAFLESDLNIATCNFHRRIEEPGIYIARFQVATMVTEAKTGELLGATLLECNTSFVVGDYKTDSSGLEYDLSGF